MKNLKISEGIRLLIEADLRKNPNNIYVIGRRYGVTKSVVEFVLNQMYPHAQNPVARSVTVSFDLEEVPARLRPFVVEAKAVCAAWSMSDQMQAARQAYDNGEVELCTGRIRRQHGDVLVLYCIPRRFPDLRRAPYFSAVSEG